MVCNAEDVAGKLYHSWRPLFSREWDIAIVEGDRDIGKSYGMMIRAVKRCMRKGVSMAWLRRTDEEAKALAAMFPSTKWEKIARRCGITIDRLRRHGNRILLQRVAGKDEWVTCIRYASVSGWAKLRDTDEPHEELMYIDDAFTTVERLRRYAGDECSDAMDAWVSLRRENVKYRLLIAGNMEKTVNPYLEYFGIKRPRIDSGIVVFRSDTRTIAYERARNLNVPNNLLSGTTYGDFMSGDPKGAASTASIRKIPPGARLYLNADFGHRCSVWMKDGSMWISTRKASGKVLKSAPDGDDQTVVLTANIRKRCVQLRESYRRGRLWYDSAEAAEYAGEILRLLL